MNDILQLGNGVLSVSFDCAEDGFGIRGIACGTSEKACFVNPSAAGASFWELTFRGKAADGAEVTARLDNRSVCRSRRVEKTADGGAVFIWEGVELPEEGGAVTVRATVQFEADASSRWSLTVQNSSTRLALMETRYPVLRQTAADGEADVLLPRPDLGARQVKACRWLERDRRFGCLGYCPMMTALFKGTNGLYVAAHDSQARIKNLQVSGQLDVSFITPVENAGICGKAAEGPRFDVTIAALQGDWWQAAALYRRWALTTPWTAKGRILDRGDYPRRLAEIPLWLNTHAYPQEVTETMDTARKVFPECPVGIHWHLWQHSGHDVNYPEYFPEQPGTQETLAHCHSIDCEAMPYVNGRLWSNNLLSFPLVKHLALTNPDGQARVERYGTLTPPVSPMCPYTQEWNDTLNDFTGRVLDLGAGSIFIDQIGASSAAPCYHPDHGHPIGGGTWYFEGYQAMLGRVHERYAAKGAFITTEGSGEEWMNVVDGYLQVTQRQPDDVPFFHAVYGGYTTYFCSPENQDDDFESFRAAQTRELLWGQALGWYHPLILQQADKCELLRKLAAFRQEHLDCFAYGTLLGEVKVLDEVPPQAVTWLGRKAFFLWKVPDAPLSPTINGSLPSIMGYRWRNGKTGESEVFMANVGTETRTVRVELGGVEQRVTLAAGELRSLKENI